MKRTIVFILLVGFAFAGCKNRNAAKKLEGTWNETKINGTVVPEANQDQMTFAKCGGGENKECDLTVTDCCGGGSENFYYAITDGGETMVIKTTSGFGQVSVYHTIQSLTDNQLVIEWNWSGNDYVGTYTKQ